MKAEVDRVWKQRKRLIGEYMVLFLVGGLLYAMLEILWRGYTYPVMVVIGGIGFLLVGVVRDWFPWELPIAEQGLLGGTAITGLELLSGLFLNRCLGLHIWDYSHLPLNLLGQICLPFWFLWCLLAVGAAVAEDYLRYWFFQGEKPRYWLKKNGSGP